MAVELLANLAASTLSADITSTSATTLTVTSATGFPAAATGTSQFRILIGTEIMIVTNVSGTTFTVTRGAESTTAATHSSGDPVTHVVTAGVFQAMFGGGTAGQAWTKTGSADYAASWTTPGWGGGAYFLNDETIRDRAVAALATNKAFIDSAKPGTAAAQASAAYDQTKALTRQVNGLIRLVLGRLDGTD
jgi:hypothetical protein